MPSYEVVQEEEMAVPEVIPNVIFPEIEEPVVVPPIVEKPLVEEEQGEVIVDEVDPPSAFSGFVIDENGMICGIDTEILSISDGYLELPFEDCVGIRRGALAEIGDLIREVFLFQMGIWSCHLKTVLGFEGVHWQKLMILSEKCTFRPTFLQSKKEPFQE